ncbi:hypothetical protein CDAIGKPJ_03603 [Aeromonas salmonicida]
MFSLQQQSIRLLLSRSLVIPAQGNIRPFGDPLALRISLTQKVLGITVTQFCRLLEPLDGISICTRLFAVPLGQHQLSVGMISLGCLLEPVEAFTNKFASMLLLTHQSQPIAGIDVAKTCRALPPLCSERRISGLTEPGLIPVTYLPCGVSADLLIGS